MNDKQITTEVVVCVCEDGELTHIVRKNGTIEWFKVSPMRFDDLASLLGADKLPE